MNETLHELSVRTQACADTTVTYAPEPPLIVVLGDNRGAAADWCASLLAEGLAASWDTASGEAAVAADVLVLHCTRRLAERLAVLREWRTADPARPIAVVCQGLRDLDHVLALEMGADDVIDADTSAAVVAARLRTLARRRARALAGQPGPDTLSFGALALHLRERRVQLRGADVALTEGEFEVLWLLATQAGRAVSRADMLRRLRGLPYQRIDRSIDCRVYRIRAKLGDLEGPAQHIRTVRNCGYLFSPAAW